MQGRRKEDFATDYTDRRFAAARIVLVIGAVGVGFGTGRRFEFFFRVGAKRHPCFIRGKPP
jgi:hypothetical protein